MEQGVLASHMEWVQVTLVSLVVVLWMVLASFVDSAVLDSFLQRTMPSFQTNFCQWALMVDLVANSSPRASLASSQKWPTSVGGAPPLDPGVSAVGKGAVGMSPREASPISASSRALTWDDVSTGAERSPYLWGRGMSMTMGFSLSGIEFPDVCPDVSNTAWDRSYLTSMVMLTSLSAFGRVALTGLTIRMEGQIPENGTFSSDSPSVDCRMPTFR